MAASSVFGAVNGIVQSTRCWTVAFRLTTVIVVNHTTYALTMTDLTTVPSARIQQFLADPNLETLCADLERDGGPIVEPIEGDDENVLVTFVWIGEADAVTLATGLMPQSEPAKMRTMQRVPGSDVWWFSTKLARDVCTTYCFVPDDATLQIDDVVA